MLDPVHADGCRGERDPQRPPKPKRGIPWNNVLAKFSPGTVRHLARRSCIGAVSRIPRDVRECRAVGCIGRRAVPFPEIQPGDFNTERPAEYILLLGVVAIKAFNDVRLLVEAEGATATYAVALEQKVDFLLQIQSESTLPSRISVSEKSGA